MRPWSYPESLYLEMLLLMGLGTKEDKVENMSSLGVFKANSSRSKVSVN